MQQLLEITTVPLKMEVTTTRARFEKMDPMDAALEALNSPQVKHTGQPQSHHTGGNGTQTGMGQNQNIRVINPNSSAQGTNTGFQTVGTSTASSVNTSDVYVSAGVESKFGGMLYQASAQNAASVNTGIPEAAYVEAGLQNAEMTHVQMQSSADTADQSAFRADMMNAYSADRENFDMSLNLGLRGMKFVPGSIDFEIVQMNDVQIEYVGGPIYVPRSADPNYVEETVA